MNNRDTRCTGFILNEKDQLLLLKHCNSNGKEYWWLPSGGIENNETVEVGLKREIKEELNLDINITNSFVLENFNPERTYNKYFVGIIRIDSNTRIILEEDGKGKIKKCDWFDITDVNKHSTVIRDRDILPIVNAGLKFIEHKNKNMLTT